MFKNIFKRKNNKKKISGLTEIVNYDVAIETNINKEQLYRLFTEEKIQLLESLDDTINNLNSKRIMKEKLIQHLDTNIHNSNLVLQNNRKEIDDFKTKLECSICNDREINRVLNPCGHTFCAECISNTNYCYVCRRFIIEPLKLYFN